MAKIVKCKTCGQDIAKSAKTCPHCGAKAKKTNPILGAALVIIGLVIVVSAFGSGDDQQPALVDDAAQQSGSPQQEEQLASEDQQDQADSPAEEKTTFTVGEQVELNDVIVTMVDVTENSGTEFLKPNEGHAYVICEFEVQNNSDRELNLSSLMSFDAYFDDYATSISISALSTSDKDQLGGTVAPGKKINGIVGYEVADDWNTVEIHFTPDFWSGKEIVFTYSK